MSSLLDILADMAGTALALSLSAIGAGDGTETESAAVRDPMIRSMTSRCHFVVYFCGCTGNAGCNALQFAVGHDFEAPFAEGAPNGWNQERRFAFAYLDEQGDPRLKMDVLLGAGGMGAEDFGELPEIWRVSIAEFETYFEL